MILTFPTTNRHVKSQKGTKLHLPVPKVNVGHLLHDELKKRNSNDIAFKSYLTNESNSVGEIFNNSLKLAQALTDSGLTSDDLIAINTHNHVNYPIIVLAALYTGIPLALMNPAYTAYELENLFKIVEPKVVFCSKINLETLLTAKSKSDTIKKVVVIDELKDKIDNKDVTMLEKFLECSNTNFKIKQVNTKEHIAFIMFSSGTTGLPKAVVTTHHNINATLIAIQHPSMGTLPLDMKTVLGVLPFFHVFGFYQQLQAIQKSIPMIVMEHFNPLHYLRCIEKYKLWSLTAVSPLVNYLAKTPSIDEHDLSNLTDIVCGSAPIGEDILLLVKNRLKLNDVRIVYGTTEAHMIIATTPPGSTNIKSVGKIGIATTLCIRDVETGRNLPANHQGEICTKSEMMMKCYYKNETATKEAFTEDGYLKSGDIGYYDEEGYIYIVDRLKEFIKCKGFQVSPSELEAVLITNKKIADVGVIGKPDESAGEVPIAFVVKVGGVNLSQEEVKEYLAGILSKHKQLYDVYFVDEIPRTSSGKIIRRELKRLLNKMTQSKL
ncbi:luciferin 4-monooxygenase-like [Onthophagus taurus]|uniref:luciferin 4-monooxygenase-like n=1 Tax=Onthophagus taurus TaxID=166361 RepID=UPI0039BE0171